MAAEKFDLVVFGASGATGAYVVEQALERGLSVLAAHHELPAESSDSDRLRDVKADVMSDDLAPIIAQGDKVISCLGVAFSPSAAMNPPPLYSQGTASIIEGMKTAGRSRIAVISAAFVDHQERLPAWFRTSVVTALMPILEDMLKMEAALEGSGLEWTTARPGWLLDHPYTGDYHVGDGKLPEGTLRTRNADLAAVLLDAVTKNQWVEAKPSPARKESALDESPAAVLRDVEAMVREAVGA